MPIMYTHNYHCGDGLYEQPDYDAAYWGAYDAAQMVGSNEATAAIYESQRQNYLDLAWQAYLDGNTYAQQGYLQQASFAADNRDTYLGYAEDWEQAGQAAEADMEAEAGDYDTEWAGWYAIGIQNGASHADAADCAHDCTVS